MQLIRVRFVVFDRTLFASIPSCVVSERAFVYIPLGTNNMGTYSYEKHE